MEDFKQFSLAACTQPRKPMTGYQRHEVPGKDARYEQGIDCDQPRIACIGAAIMAGAFRAIQ